jgi:ATP dependent DNA ligase domain
VILDGEVIAWDSVREETVPFGSNRTIAKYRKDWMASKGKLDSRDQGMHDDDSNNKSMTSASNWIDNSDSLDVGDECWLQFVAFDILFVDGPGAADLLSETVSAHIIPRPSPGSIIELEAIERKKLLYKLIDPQPKEVEIVNTWIIRPNGMTDSGERYFNPLNPSKECGYAAYTLDSLSAALSGVINGIAQIDTERRHDRSDEQISEARAHAIQSLYENMVEEQRLEGLVFKDLSSPYYLGEESKSTRYWHKFKPDYFNGSAASDLDLVVVGAYYASGLRNSGKPSTLLCACVDSEDSERFFPICKVSLGSVDASQSNELLKTTGYLANDSDDEEDFRRENAWERSNWAAKSFPEFLSLRSFQSNNENKGWRVQKKDCK